MLLQCKHQAANERHVNDSYNQIETDNNIDTQLAISDVTTTDTSNLANQHLINTTNKNVIDNIHATLDNT